MRVVEHTGAKGSEGGRNEVAVTRACAAMSEQQLEFVAR